MMIRLSLASPSLVMATVIGLLAHSEIVSAQPFVPIPTFADGDFEVQQCPNGVDSCSYDFTTGWLGYILDSASLVNNDDPNAIHFSGGIPSGRQAMTIVHPIGTPLPPPIDNSNSFYQINSIGNYLPNRIYRLSGMFGYDELVINDPNTDILPAQARINLMYGPSYPYVAASELFIDPNDTGAPAVGSFVPFEITLNTQTYPDAVGNGILVRLAAAPLNASFQQTTSWDNMKLEVQQIPEPASLCMLAVGLFSSGVVWRRHRR